MKWIKAGRDYVTLYHGTNSLLLPKILKEGLRVPDYGLLYMEMLDKFSDYTSLADLSEIAAQELDVSFRFALNKSKIHLTMNRKHAEDYARDSGRMGGEFIWDISNQLGLYSKSFKKYIDAFYAESKPVVLEIKMPINELNEKDRKFIEVWKDVNSDEIYHEFQFDYVPREYIIQ